MSLAVKPRMFAAAQFSCMSVVVHTTDEETRVAIHGEETKDLVLNVRKDEADDFAQMFLWAGEELRRQSGRV